MIIKLQAFLIVSLLSSELSQQQTKLNNQIDRARILKHHIYVNEHFNWIDEDAENNSSSLITTKHNLNATTNQSQPVCKSPSINEFPHDFVPFKEYNYARLLIHALIVVYLLIALSIVCDDYFVVSLGKIASDLNLRDDVAGATLMAAGSSAPELFTSLIGVTVAQSDIGTGTIVGSALFNVLFIIAICGIVVKTSEKVNYYPIIRDCFFYLVSVLALIFVLFDGIINLYESLALLALYFIYILIMYFNEKIEHKIRKTFGKKSTTSKAVCVNSIKMEGRDGPIAILGDSTLSLSTPHTPRNSINCITITQTNLEKVTDEQEDKEKLFSPCKSSTSNVFLYPINFLFYFTIPDCRRKQTIFAKCPFYFLTFLVSCVYIALLTYLIVWMVVIISFEFKIPDTVAGLTFLAAGSSLPEIVSSIIIARRSRAGMAISNSIGSNVFDVLVCLGLPWLVQTSINKTEIHIYSGALIYTVGLLLISILILVASFKLNKWRIDKKLGAWLLIVWTILTIISCLFEYDVFGKFSIPNC